MTAEQLAQYAGILLSLGLAYIPWFANWYTPKDAPAKARIMGGLLVLTALGIFGLTCAHWITAVALAVTCDKAGLSQLAQILLAALIANQTTYLLLVRPFKQ